MAFDVWVDFNSMNDGVVRTLAAFVPPHVTLAPGRDVVVGDDDGTIAKARVEAVEGGIITLRVDTSSFVPETASPVPGIAK